MLFNSIEYLFFFVIVYVFYWLINNKSLINQNFLLLISSYAFYGWWDYRFLGLIFFSTITDFIIARKIFTTKSLNTRKVLLILSLVVNIGLLGFFKYYNFFLDSWINLLSSIGYQVNSITTLSIILPVGISFYTFQTLSYTLDVYHKRFTPTSSFLNFSTFVALFPQLVAGPIERAKNLLPQIEQRRLFSKENLTQGLTLILWGLFKKVVVADSLAPLVDKIFNDPLSFNGGTLLLGLFYFTFQIYCDFSGYSDIAIGTAKCFGFKFMSNFNYPYFAKNIRDFWRRWHISLSTWFRDYIFIPLGGSKVKHWHFIKNILIVFSLSGLWHGPNLTFIFWGLTHSILYFVMRFIKIVPSNFKYKVQIIAFFTFMTVMLSWVFFRSPTISFAFDYLHHLFVTFSFPKYPVKGLYYVIILLLFDYIFQNDSQNILNGINPFKKRVIVVILFAFVWVHFSSSPKNFIYFQF